MASFDPYHKWLGIPPDQQPVSHYRLLGIEDFEFDSDVIEGAAERQTVFLRSFQTGPNSELAERLLNEVSVARICLLDGNSKARYDQRLQATLQPVQPPELRVSAAVPGKTPIPVIPRRRRVASRRPAAKSLWQQPWVMATAGAVSVVLLFIFLNSVSFLSRPTVNSKGATTAKVGQNRKIPDKRTKKEQEAELDRLVEDRVKEALLKVEQERLAALETVAKESAAEKAAVEKAAVEKAAVEKAAVEKAAVEKAAVEKAADKKAAAKKAADKKAADKKVADKKAADKKAAEKEAADKKVTEGRTDLATVNLAGTWRSTRTGTLYRIEDNGSTLAVSLLKSDEMSFFKGVFQRQGISLTSSVWECRFKKFAKGQTLKGDSKAYIRRSNTIRLRIPYFSADKNGKVQRKTTAQTTWVRQPVKR